MSDYVYGGILDKLKGLLDSFSKVLDKGCQLLAEAGWEVEDVKEADGEEGFLDGAETTFKLTNGKKLNVKTFPSAKNNNKCNMVADYMGRKQTFKDIDCDSWQDTLKKWVDESLGQEISQSKKMYVELKTVEGGKSVEIGRVYASYNSLEAYDDISEVLENDEFCDTLTDEFKTYSIIPNDECLDVDVCEDWTSLEYDTPLPDDIYLAAIKFRESLLNSATNDHQFQLSSSYYTVNNIIWALCEYKLSRHLSAIDTSNIELSYDVNECKEELAQLLDFYYNNLPHEVKPLIDEWLFTLRYQTNYDM